MGTLHGLAAIAAVIDRDYDQTRYLVATGQIPVFKVGKRVCSTKALLAEWLAANEAKARAAFEAHQAARMAG